MSSTSLSRRAYRRAVAKTRVWYFFSSGSKLAVSPPSTAAISSASVRSTVAESGIVAEGTKAESHRANAVAFLLTQTKLYPKVSSCRQPRVSLTGQGLAQHQSGRQGCCPALAFHLLVRSLCALVSRNTFPDAAFRGEVTGQIGFGERRGCGPIPAGRIWIHPPSLKSPAPSPGEARAGRGRGERGSFHRIVALF